MTRKEKLEQTKKLADLWYQQPASNKSHTKIIQEKLYHRNEVLLNG